MPSSNVGLMDQGAVDEAFRMIRQLGENGDRTASLIQSLLERIQALEAERDLMKQNDAGLAKLTERALERIDRLEKRFDGA